MTLTWKDEGDEGFVVRRDGTPVLVMSDKDMLVTVATAILENDVYFTDTGKDEGVEVGDGFEVEGEELRYRLARDLIDAALIRYFLKKVFLN